MAETALEVVVGEVEEMKTVLSEDWERILSLRRRCPDGAGAAAGNGEIAKRAMQRGCSPGAPRCALPSADAGPKALQGYLLTGLDLGDLRVPPWRPGRRAARLRSSWWYFFQQCTAARRPAALRRAQVGISGYAGVVLTGRWPPVVEQPRVRRPATACGARSAGMVAATRQCQRCAPIRSQRADACWPGGGAS